jgi:hypothetical protein
MNAGESESRISLNLRLDADKHFQLEKLRLTGFGFAETTRNRSDVYNEVLGYGLELYRLKQELGERDFEKWWAFMQKLNLKKLNFDNISKMVE